MAERITFTLHELVSTLDTFADDLLRARHGVGFGTFHFLAIAADVQPADMTTLARCLGVTKAAVSKRVPSLVAEGWIEATADPHHGRRILVTLTEQAMRLLHAAGGELETEFTALLADPRLLATGFDARTLNSQLELLTALVNEKGPLA